MPIASSRTIGYRARPEPLWESRQSFFAEVALFILGVAGYFSINLIGALPGSEVILLPFLPILLLAKGSRAFNRQYLMFYILAGGWFIGTQIADTYNGIWIVLRMKGTARVVFFILDFVALAILLNNKTRRFVIFALSIAVVLILGSWQSFSGDFNVQWKFGLSQGIAIFALLGSSYFYSKGNYRIWFLISFVLAALNLHYGFRSQLAIHFVASVLIWPLSAEIRTRHGVFRGRQDTTRILTLLFLAGGAAYVANAAIKFAAQHDFFDESQNSKFISQAEGDYGVLVGGRPETLVAIQAIRDSPIIGHGSFPEGMKYIQLKQDIQYQHGYSGSDEPDDTETLIPVIPTHSHLTLAWVEGGILGGLCWIYISILTVRGVFRVTALRPHLAPLYSYLLISFLWDILYSPFGSVNRIRAAFYILLSYSLLRTPVAAALQVQGPKFRMPYRRRPLPLPIRATH
jgi:O-antigen ligase